MAPFFNNEIDNYKYRNTISAFRNLKDELGWKGLYRGFWRYNLGVLPPKLILFGLVLLNHTDRKA
jgi:hypothetical protein